MSTGRARRAGVLLGMVVGLAVAAVTASAAATALSLSDDPGVSTGVDPIVIVTPTDSVTPQPIDDTPLEPSPMPTPDISTEPDDSGESGDLGESSIEVDAPVAVIVDDHGEDGPRTDDSGDSGGDTSGGDGSGSSGGSGSGPSSDD